jgi:DNA modification methylase
VACLETGRDFVGSEIDPTYAALARRRIDAAARPSAAQREMFA